MSHLSSLEIAHMIARDKYHLFTDPERDDETARICRWLADHHENADQVFVDPSHARDFRAGLTLATSIFQQVHHALIDNGGIDFIETAHFGPAIIFGCGELAEIERRTREIYGRNWVVRQLDQNAGTLIRRFKTFDEFAEAYRAFHQKRAQETRDREARLARSKEHAMALKSLTPAMVAKIKAAWSRESAMNPAAWSEDTPSKDQCAVTAALIYDLTGLEVVRGEALLPDGSTDSHYWNEGVDLTADQFPEGTETRRRNGVQGREAYDYLLTNPDLVRRLCVLRGRYEAA